MRPNTPVRFTEPAPSEQLAVSEEELLLAIQSMCAVNPAFARHVLQPQTERVKPCIVRIH